jgi:hypothetical protein
MYLSDVYSIYKKMFIQFINIFKSFWHNPKTFKEVIQFIKTIITWQLQLFVTNTYMCMYFVNFSFLGKPIFLLCCFLAGCSGPHDSNILFSIGVIGIVLFIHFNILLYALVQIDYIKQLLLKAIGYRLFDNYVGFNSGGRAATKGVSYAKSGFLTILGLNVTNEGVHFAKTLGAGYVFDQSAPSMDTLSEPGKLALNQQRVDFIKAQAPYISLVSRFVDPKSQQAFWDFAKSFWG